MTHRSEPVSLADPGALMATTHEVGDGLRVRLRLARPSDGEHVRAFLESLSPETCHRRFFSPMPVVSQRMVRHFTFFDPRERLIVMAAAMTEGHEEIVGMADVALLGTGVAEVAVVVGDQLQHQGVGRLLTEVIASLAVHQGATHLRAQLLEHNAPMLRLMERLGRTVRTVADGNTEVITKLPTAQRRRAA